jgi:SsrA-binding protein
MARPTPPAFDKKKVVAENRRARFDYHIEDTFEAGIMLTGTEVKSLRFGEGSIAESYAEVKGQEAWHRREVDRLQGAVERKGMTLVPLSIYFNSRGRAKVELALAKGKNAADKRQTIKERDWKREQARIMRDHA